MLRKSERNEASNRCRAFPRILLTGWRSVGKGGAIVPLIVATLFLVSFALFQF